MLVIDVKDKIMNKYAKIIERIAQLTDYDAIVNEILENLQSNFPNVSLKPFAEFKSFLDALIPKLIHKYMLLTNTMKVCSTISIDFAEIAATAGFAMLIDRKQPGHVRNIVLTSNGPYLVDLSYIQYVVCEWDLTNPKTKKEALKEYQALY